MKAKRHKMTLGERKNWYRGNMAGWMWKYHTAHYYDRGYKRVWDSGLRAAPDKCFTRAMLEALAETLEANHEAPKPSV